MTEKMPDEVWLGLNPGWNSLEHKIDGYGTKYLRAEPVEALLKQARDALDAWDEDFAPTPNDYLDLIETIDKFLGERK